MKKAPPRLLAIDASVARAAGETVHPVSSACREFLLAVLRICHRAVVCDEMRDEWQRHQSKFTRKWRCSMAARKKPLRDVCKVETGLDLQAFASRQREAIEKDMPLLETALAAGGEIVTLDEALYKALGSAPQGERLRDRFTWHNPVTDGTAHLGPKSP